MPRALRILTVFGKTFNHKDNTLSEDYEDDDGDDENDNDDDDGDDDDDDWTGRGSMCRGGGGGVSPFTFLFLAVVGPPYCFAVIAVVAALFINTICKTSDELGRNSSLSSVPDFI